VLSYPFLGAETVMSLLQHRESVILGEGFDLFYVPMPASLAGLPLADSHIRARTGLNVLALRQSDDQVVPVTASTVLELDCELVMLGNESQRQKFTEVFK